MLTKIIFNFFIGIIIGFVLEFSYRSQKNKRMIIPKFVNFQMYGLTGAFLVFVYFLNIELIIKLILIFIFPTLVEFITGYLYLKIKGVYLWDYSNNLFNYKKLICPLFSFYWFLVAIAYYCLLVYCLN